MEQIKALLKIDQQKLNSVEPCSINAKKKFEGWVPNAICKDLPLYHGLREDEFEPFCLDLLRMLYPKNAKIHRYGRKGHTQEGIDIEVILSDGICHTFQCKRQAKFSPDGVKNVIKKHIYKGANKKFILISCKASPKTRNQTKQHPDWDIWDVDDISSRFRIDLSKDNQKRLVRLYFPNHQLALLGENEPGPWLTIDDFFLPYGKETNLFNHTWPLIGRDKELSETIKNLEEEHISLVLISAPGGSGKSKLLKSICEQYADRNPKIMLRIASLNETLTRKSIEDLGTGKKLLIIDDAHDRIRDIEILFHATANPNLNIKLLILCRPYAKENIKYKASILDIVTLSLPPLTIIHAEQLATAALKKFGGNKNYASIIANITHDCTFAIVACAYLVAKDKINPLHINAHSSFKNQLVGIFTDIITGKFSSNPDRVDLRKLLELIALLQPIDPDSKVFKDITKKMIGIESHEISRLIKILNDFGVLSKNNGLYSLLPDLLADFIIENVCFSENGNSIQYAEKVFDLIDHQYLKNILINLSKLDWRLSQADNMTGSNLEYIWIKIKENPQKWGNGILQAVQAVAYYQPKQALDFAQYLMEQREYLAEIPLILKYIAYHPKYLDKACGFLWDLRDHSYPSRNHPDHPIQILKELCTLTPQKPKTLCSRAIDYMLYLLDANNIWNNRFTPFDILKDALEINGYTSKYDENQMVFQTYRFPPETLISIRVKIIDAAIKYLNGDNTIAAIHAASFLSHALRYPVGYFNEKISNEESNSWNPEFCTTLEKIKNVVQTNKPNDLVAIYILKTIHWHRSWGKEQSLETLADEIYDLIPKTLEFKTTLALLGKWDCLTKQHDFHENLIHKQKNLEQLADDLLNHYSQAKMLVEFIKNKIDNIIENNSNEYLLSYELIGCLSQRSVEFAKAFILNDLQIPIHCILPLVGSALANIMKHDRNEAILVSKKLLDSKIDKAQDIVAHAYHLSGMPKDKYNEEEISIICLLLYSNNAAIVSLTLCTITHIATYDKKLAIKLLLKIDFDNDILEEILRILLSNTIISFETCSLHDIKEIFEKLKLLPDLKYTLFFEMFISEASYFYPKVTARFLIELIQQKNEWYIMPQLCPKQMLNFRKTPSCLKLMHETISCLSANADKDHLPRYKIAVLFIKMFGPFDELIIAFLKNLLDKNTSGDDLLLISAIIAEAPSNFIFNQKTFCAQLLDTTERIDKKTYQTANNALFTSARNLSVSRVTAYTQDDCKEQFILLKENCMQALTEYSPFSLLGKLYSSLIEDAEQIIKKYFGLCY